MKHFGKNNTGRQFQSNLLAFLFFFLNREIFKSSNTANRKATEIDQREKIYKGERPMSLRIATENSVEETIHEK